MQNALRLAKTLHKASGVKDCTPAYAFTHQAALSWLATLSNKVLPFMAMSSISALTFMPTKVANTWLTFTWGAAVFCPATERKSDFQCRVVP
ncbi:hypothetical protein [Comamonas sp. C24C]